MFTSDMKVLFTILTCVILMFSLEAYGQEKKKIRSSYEQDQSEIYLKEAENVQDDDPTKSTEYLQQALQEAIKNKNHLAEGEAYYLLGNINSNAQQYDLAVGYYKKSKQAFNKVGNNEGLYKVTQALANAYKNNKEYNIALQEYASFLSLARRYSNVDDQITSLQARASIYQALGNSELALAELDQAENLALDGKKVNPKLSNVKLQRGEVLESQAKDEEAYQQYQESGEVAKSLNDKQGVINSNFVQSKYLNKRGRRKEGLNKQKENLSLLQEERNEESIEAEEEVLNEYNKPSFKVEETKTNIEIAKNYIELDSNEQAIEHLKTAIDLSNKLGALVERKDAYGYLSEAYFKAGDYDSALVNYRNYVSLVDSLYKLKEADILASLDLNNELSSRLQRINSLEKDHKLQEKAIELLESQRQAEEARNKQLKVVIYSLVIGLVLLLLLIYFMFKNAKQKKVTNQLLALKSLRTQMNPHFIFNALNSVNNFISQNDERSANKYLSDFSRLMRLVLENSEHDFISLNNEIEILKLYIALEHSRFSEKFDYQLEIDSNLDTDKYEIPPMIVQPYIENAVWHGLRYLENKGELSISMKEENDVLIIQITDNGIGRKQSQAMKTKNQKSSRSTAMKNIAERLQIINEIHQSKVQVDVSNLNQDGSGTQVIIKVQAQQ